MPLRLNFFRKNKDKVEPRPGYRDHDHPPYLDPNRAIIDVPSPDSELGRLFDQDQSLFCRLLPREIRILIFEYVIGKRIIHLDFDYQEKKYPYQTLRFPSKESETISPATSGEWQWWHGICMGNEIPGREEYNEPWYHDNCQSVMTIHRNTVKPNNHHGPAKQFIEIEKKFKVNLTLLTVCKKLYFEAMFVLYSRNTFDFVRPKLLVDHLPKLWTNNQLQLLRSIQIGWYMPESTLPHRGVSRSTLFSPDMTVPHDAYLDYDRFWKVLSEMPGLSVLRVALLTVFLAYGKNESPLSASESHEREMKVEEMKAAWLGPIDRLKKKQLSKFVLVLGLSWIEVMWDTKRAYSALDFSGLPGIDVDTALPVGDEPFSLVAFNDKSEPGSFLS